VRLTASEQIMQGKRGGGELFESASQACLELQALTDIHAGADYRRSVAATVTRRALATAHQRALAAHEERR
jgi:CO/xanthine dehydrogenase FAD-binding subunit